jgi:beta-glucosidase
VAGKEVVQLYVAAPQSTLAKPAKELRAFAKSATLAAGESERVELRLSLYDLASFDESRGCWVAEAGEYRLLLGSSVEDIRVEVVFKLDAEKCWAVTSPVHKNTTAKSSELSAEDGGDFYWQM